MSALALPPKRSTGIPHAGELPNALAHRLNQALFSDEGILVEAGRHEGVVPLEWAIVSHPCRSKDAFTVMGVPRLAVNGTTLSVVLAGPSMSFAHLNLVYILSEAAGVPLEQILRMAKGALAYKWDKVLQIDGHPGRGTLPLGMGPQFTAAFRGARALNLLRVDNKLGPWKQLRDRLYRRMLGHPNL